MKSRNGDNLAAASNDLRSRDFDHSLSSKTILKPWFFFFTIESKRWGSSTESNETREDVAVGEEVKIFMFLYRDWNDCDRITEVKCTESD